jgi:hypothetical protein
MQHRPAENGAHRALWIECSSSVGSPAQPERLRPFASLLILEGADRHALPLVAVRNLILGHQLAAIGERLLNLVVSGIAHICPPGAMTNVFTLGTLHAFGIELDQSNNYTIINTTIDGIHNAAQTASGIDMPFGGAANIQQLPGDVDPPAIIVSGCAL